MGDQTRYDFLQLVLGGNMPRPRYQKPIVKKTTGADPRWYIMPRIDVLTEQGIRRVRRRIQLGRCAEMTRRQAEQAARQLLDRINNSRQVLENQVRFGDFVKHYLRNYVQAPGVLAASTAAKYEGHIRNHILPAFGHLPMGQITPERIEQWLAQKAAQGLSWSTRCDLRNILSGIFSKAMDWGYHIDRNPVERVAVGRRRMAREHRKLTDDQIRTLLAALHPDVRLIVTMALLSALRISEVLGLQWQDVDLERRIVYVRRRWYRGELDWVKSARSERPVPLPEVIAQELERVPPGDRKPDEFVFGVRTAHGTICRDDRDINQHFLRPVAKALGIYYPGFGFHAFRREAITHLARLLDPFQAQRMAGHTHPRMTAWYTLLDVEGQRRAQQQLQSLVIPDGENLAKPA